MSPLPPDPIAPGGLQRFARRLRNREITVQEATSRYLERIRLLQPALGAFEWVDEEGALATARALDVLLERNTDLGPLMGVPVALKDVIAVAGMPVTAGSYVDVSDLIGPEGGFVGMLRRAGCVFLGKTKTVEFALGAAHHTRGAPRNPCDARVHRSPGGSSSGSAVAVAAGLCGFSVGTDTGGSVRIPAAFCGVVGFKTTAGRWPLDGILSTAPSMDSIGFMTASASDAALVYCTLQGVPIPAPSHIKAMRLGYPATPFLEDTDPEVVRAVNQSLEGMRRAGASIGAMQFPEAVEAARNYAIVTPTEFLGVFTRERLLANRDRISPAIVDRALSALDVSAEAYLRLMMRRAALSGQASKYWSTLDGVVAPTLKLLPIPAADLDNEPLEHDYHRRVASNTRPANVLELCALTLPIRSAQSTLPAGLQLMCGRFEELKALSVALSIESIVGPAAPLDMSGFTS